MLTDNQTPEDERGKELDEMFENNVLTEEHCLRPDCDAEDGHDLYVASYETAESVANEQGRAAAAEVEGVSYVHAVQDPLGGHLLKFDYDD